MIAWKNVLLEKIPPKSLEARGQTRLSFFRGEDLEGGLEQRRRRPGGLECLPGEPGKKRLFFCVSRLTVFISLLLVTSSGDRAEVCVCVCVRRYHVPHYKQWKVNYKTRVFVFVVPVGRTLDFLRLLREAFFLL